MRPWFSRMFIFMLRHVVHTHLMNHRYNDRGQNPNTTIGACAWIQMAQAMGSPIYILDLFSQNERQVAKELKEIGLIEHFKNQ